MSYEAVVFDLGGVVFPSPVVILSIVAVALDWLTLTIAGTVFVLVQAAAVAGLAELQLQSLRRASHSAAAAR